MTLLKTPLDALHRELGAKMVPFAGYDMPVQYPSGIIKEHLQTREAAGLFDVSHMGQVIIEGAGTAAMLETLVPVDIEGLGKNRQTYALFTNEQGGVLDDLIITRWDQDRFFLVVNAACKEQDIAHLRAHLSGQSLTVLEDQGLLALQGPGARAVMRELCPAAADLVFMQGCQRTGRGRRVYHLLWLYRRGRFRDIGAGSAGARRWREPCWPPSRCRPSGWVPGIPCAWRPGCACTVTNCPRYRSGAGGPVVVYQQGQARGRCAPGGISRCRGIFCAAWLTSRPCVG